ncbi:MAG: M28 family peptidase [Bradymonadaceae bacterium]
MTEDAESWTGRMPDEQFDFMQSVLAAPSPVGFEGAMTYGVLEPYLQKHALDDWEIRTFQGNASLALDTAPDRDDAFTVMVVGHADKIRMQVRSIGDDGKIWIDSDSFLPLTLLGHEVQLFSEDPDSPGDYRTIDGGTIEAIGAIHFADRALRTGDEGIKKEQLYLELGIHGDDKKEQIEELGIRPGDPIILDREIERGFTPQTFQGAYLDNGLGCFVTAEIARLLAEEGGLDDLRVLPTIATHEEIGRFGSRVLAGELEPDAIIAVDVNHDYVAAPNLADERPPPLEMGEGFTLSVGSIVSEPLNAVIQETAQSEEIPYQRDVVGRDTGTDGMAGALAAIDAAATSIGFPIRNMHTISELGHTGDVRAAIHGIVQSLQALDSQIDGLDDWPAEHPRLDRASALSHGGFDDE